MASSVIIIVDPQNPTGAMSQPQAFEYLFPIITHNAGDKRRSCLSQALNDVFSNPAVKGLEGKANDDLLLYDGKKTRHASAGPAGKNISVTLFFYVIGDIAYIFAMGEHEGAGYRICHFGQPNTAFKMKALIVLKKKR